MAKRVLTEYYSFNPGTKTVIIPNKIVTQEQLLLITNVSSNTVIFNFSDPDLTATSFVAPYSSTGTQIVLNYNTSAMGTSDALSILIDEAYDIIDLQDTLQDPTDKLRTASPQSLIDTDFEYGLQPIKWESMATVQNIPSYFFKSGGNSLPVTAMTGGNQSPRSMITVTTAAAHGMTTGDIVSVYYSNSPYADGAFTVNNIFSATQFGYTSNAQINGTIYTSSVYVLAGTIFDSNNQPVKIVTNTLTSDNNTATPGSMITVNTVGKHGLLPNSPIYVNSSTTLTVNGQWYVYDVPTPTSFRFQTPGIQTGTTTPATSAGFVVAVRPEAQFLHRPSDGGVLITTGNIQEGIQAVRQSRRYFRYQSGKGIQMSTGTKLTPTLDINTISSVGTTCTITTQQTPGCLSGVTLVVEGVEVNAGTTNWFNGTFTAASVINTSKTITYTMSGTPTDTAPGGYTPQVTVKNWRGAVVRVGMYDMQNGFYFEYDGNQMMVVRRHSTRELMGFSTVTNGSTTVGGINTKYSKQVTVGDYIVIRGASYQVVQIDSDTSMEIAPHYRGPTIASPGLRVNLTQNIKIPQSQWNLDKCDGTGPSGYVLDVTKMQMLYIDYTWYGAGFVRYGMRMANGRVAYCHKIINNNVNPAAYMRSGNLPARYEINNIGPYTRFVSASTTANGVTLGASDTTMVVKDAAYMASSGTILVQQNTSVEVIAFTGKSYNTTLNAWNLTGLSRRQFGGSTSNLTFFATEFDGGTSNFSSQCSVTYITCDCAPTISHWGTSVIMDGGYTEDRSIVFAYTKPAGVTINANTSIAVLSIRLAPSVDNSITGQFGVREIINRMQLQTKSMGLVTTTSIQILGVLNANFPPSATVPSFPASWLTTSIVNTIGTASLAQIIDHTGNTTIISGGEQIFGFVTANVGDTYDISNVRDLGNSQIGGDGSTRTPGYPNGPDVLTIVARNTSASAAFMNNLRLSWTEAQA